ncbi:MAG TPA: dTDP-4-dehydrorhamnose reductase [Thermodesulfobacteriota bacterium]
MARRRLLIAGAGGLVGRELVDRLADAPWRERLEGVPLSRADLDVTDAAAVAAALDAARPSLVVNCAAYTRVDDAEREVEAAARLNAEAPGLLAAACAARGIGLVHLSSDYVFDGRKSTPYVETDPVGPLSVYGRTKAHGERAVADAFEGRPGASWLIVRTQWLYGRAGPAFVKSVLARARAGEPLRVVDDQWGAPTYGRDLAEGLLALVDAGARGIVHVANAGATTWFGVARAVLEIVGLEGRVALEPVPTRAVPRPAARPAYGVLDCGRYRDLTGRTLRPWREALEAFLTTCS